jgi:hypothetical protein
MTDSPMNQALRRAAGRSPVPAASAIPEPQPVGDLGLGKGGAARPAARTAPAGNINASIRRAARIARGVRLDGGVDLF